MKQTTLILGAGASYEYGYPLGQKLIQRIKELAESHHDPSFLNALEEAKPYSIDAFLKENPQFSSAGKRLISLAILRCENDALYRSIEPEKDWYRKFWYQVPREEYRKLKIVTFNYDRSLEYFFARQYAGRFQVSMKEAYAKLNEVEIEHVHGRMPLLDDESLAKGQGDEFSPPYGAFANADSQNDNLALSHGEKLKTIYENTEISAKAQKFINESEVVAFVGLSYHELNMKVLGIDFKSPPPHIKLGGTAVDISAVDNSRITNSYTGIRLWSHKAIGFFDNAFDVINSKFI